MQPILRVLRALALLGGVWGVLILVGWLGDAFPPRVPEEAPSEAEGEPTDGGVADAGAPSPAPSPAPDAGVAEPDAGSAEPAGPDLPSREVARFTACDPRVARPSLSVTQVVGSPVSEVALGCGPLVQVVATPRESGGTLSPVRVLAFEATPEESGVTAHAAPPLAADVTGDSGPDLVLGFVHEDENGGARGGALYLVRASSIGAFDAPEHLASLATVDTGAAKLDGKAGADVVALHQANVFARRPSELWVFGGGPAPARLAQLRTGVGAEALAVADLDGDGHADLVALAGESERVDVFFGNGDGRFPGSATLSAAGGQDLVTGDLTGEGDAQVLLATADGLSLLRSEGDETLQAEPLETNGELTRPRVVDVDGDGRRDLIGMRDHTIQWLRRTDADDLVFEERELLRFPDGTFQPVAAEVADMDADGELDAVVLGRESDGGPWELLLLRGLERGAVLALPDAASPIPDAPLTLQMTP
ncbi:MAG: FG-GAP repeat domain-containing protein [Myxococcota bacterium]